MYAINVQSNTTYQDEQDVSLSALNVSGLLGDLQQKIGLPPKKQNVRQELLNELYQLYLEACNKEYYWKNKKRYNAYLRIHHPTLLRKGVTKEEYYKYREDFKKAKLPNHQIFLKPYSEQEHMWYKRFNKNNQQEIREMISNARTITHRKGNVIAYILKEEKFSHE